MNTFLRDVSMYFGAIGICVAAFTALLFVGTQDFNQETSFENKYCANVKNRIWPDYKQNYKEICNKELQTTAIQFNM